MVHKRDNITPIPYHFLDAQLCDRFLEDLSVELLLKLLRDSTAAPKYLFTGFRITFKNYSTSVIQKKLRGQLIQYEGLRVILCRAWLFAKKPAFEPHLGKVLTSLGSEEGALVPRLEKLRDHNDPLTLATTLIDSLIWTEIPTEDIRILISVVNINYPDQEKLSEHVDQLIHSLENDPSRFIERAKTSVETAACRVSEYNKEKDAVLAERTEYEEKLKEGNDLLARISQHRHDNRLV